MIQESSRRSFLKSSATLAAGSGFATALGYSAAGSAEGKSGEDATGTAMAVEKASIIPERARGPVKNILWICTDQQRWDTLGVTGNRFVNTPHLDRLANEGVLFERAYCQNPVCMPSRSSFTTGMYPTTVEVPWMVSMPEKHHHRLVTHWLHELGYNCGLAGKLHIAGDWSRNKALPESGFNHGYDEFLWSPCGYPANWAGCQYQHRLKSKGVPFKVRMHPETGIVQLGMPAEHHQTTWCAERAITFLELMAEKQPDQPWFFSCNIFDPHHPFDPPEELLEAYMDRLEALPLPNYEEGELDNKPQHQQAFHDKAQQWETPEGLLFDRMSKRQHRLVRAAYYAMVDLVDQQVGRILQALEESGQRDETLVIFMSDHGESLGDHGMYWKKYHLYEENIRVPLIMSWPGMRPKRKRVQEFAELVDIVPTIYDAIGTSKPEWLQGQSWWNFLNGGDPVQRDFAYAELCVDQPGREFRDMSMVRTEQHKLIRGWTRPVGEKKTNEEGELYDLHDEARERVNHWNDPAYAAVQRNLEAMMTDRRNAVATARISNTEKPHAW